MQIAVGSKAPKQFEQPEQYV